MVISEAEYRKIEEEIVNELYDGLDAYVSSDENKRKMLEEIVLKAFRKGVVLASRDHNSLKEEIRELKKQHEEYRVNSQSGFEEAVAMKNRLKRILKFVIEEM